MEGGRLIEGGAYYVFLYDSRRSYCVSSKAREWSSFAWDVYGIYKERGDKTKIKRKDNAHKRTVQAHGDGTTISVLTEKKLFSYMYSDASAVGA